MTTFFGEISENTQRSRIPQGYMNIRLLAEGAMNGTQFLPKAVDLRVNECIGECRVGEAALVLKNVMATEENKEDS